MEPEQEPLREAADLAGGILAAGALHGLLELRKLQQEQAPGRHFAAGTDLVGPQIPLPPRDFIHTSEAAVNAENHPAGPARAGLRKIWSV